MVAIGVPDDFASRASGLVDYIHQGAPVAGGDPPMVPGEPEQRSRAATTTVLIDPTTWDRLAAHAQRHGVTLPP